MGNKIGEFVFVHVWVAIVVYSWVQVVLRKRLDSEDIWLRKGKMHEWARRGIDATWPSRRSFILFQKAGVWILLIFVIVAYPLFLMDILSRPLK